MKFILLLLIASCATPPKGNAPMKNILEAKKVNPRSSNQDKEIDLNAVEESFKIVRHPQIINSEIVLEKASFIVLIKKKKTGFTRVIEVSK